MNNLTFKRLELLTLQADAERAWKVKPQYRTLYERNNEPGFWLVGDHGVYLMHNGDSHICTDGTVYDRAVNSEKSPTFGVVYANECNPKTRPDDFYDNKRRIFGGDDGVEFITAAEMKNWIAKGDTTNSAAVLIIRMSKKGFRLA